MKAEGGNSPQLRTRNLQLAARNSSFVYGPVPSRRLGLSLGINIIPAKTCTLDCVYCQCGLTTRKTVKRESFFPVKDILSAVRNSQPASRSPIELPDLWACPPRPFPSARGGRYWGPKPWGDLLGPTSRDSTRIGA